MKYKMSRFTNIIEKGEDYVLHNTISGSLMRVYDGEHKKIIDNLKEKEMFDLDEEKEISDPEFIDVLKDNNMIVIYAEDEMATLNQLFYDYENDGSMEITLIVTRLCNFKCPYCYEESENKKLTKDIYDNVIDYIINKIENNGINRVHVSFFGGEPTLEAKNIIQFMKNLNKRNSELSKPANINGGITTNGYLLTKDMVDDFLKCKISFYQITIDGFPETHNKSRILADGSGTWDRIIENVKYFKTKEENFTVTLRGNVTPSMYEKMDEWLDFINDNFGDDKRFNVHFETAKDLGVMKDSSIDLCTDENKIVTSIINKVIEKKINMDLSHMDLSRFSMVCYAAKKNSMVVDWDGTIKRCTSTVLDHPLNCCGNIKDEISIDDYKLSAAWTSYELLDKCIKCKMLPICYGKRCPASECSPSSCDNMESLYYAGIDNLLRNYKE